MKARCPGCKRLRVRSTPSYLRRSPYCHRCTHRRRRINRYVNLKPIDWRKKEAQCARCHRSFLLELVRNTGDGNRAKWPVCLECREDGWQYRVSRGYLHQESRHAYYRHNGSRPSQGGRDLDKRQASQRLYRQRNRESMLARGKAYARSERGHDMNVVKDRLRLGWSLYAARNTAIQHGPRAGHVPNVGALC